MSFLDKLLGFLGFDGLHVVFVELIEDIVPSASHIPFRDYRMQEKVVPREICGRLQRNVLPG